MWSTRDTCRLTFEQVEELQNPLVVPMRVIHASRDQDPLDTFKLVYFGDSPPLFRDDEYLIRLDTQRRIMVFPSGNKVVVQDLA